MSTNSKGKNLVTATLEFLGKIVDHSPLIQFQKKEEAKKKIHELEGILDSCGDIEEEDIKIYENKVNAIMNKRIDTRKINTSGGDN